MNRSILHTLGLAMLLIAICTLTSVQVVAQTDEKEETTVASKEESNLPKLAGSLAALPALKGVVIGMTDEQIREKLGRPQTADAASMLYVFDNGETMQIGLDADKKVRMIAAIFSGKDANAPDVKSVLGADSVIEPTNDGKIYKRVRYPEAGFWIAYSQLKLDDGPMTTVTIQKIDVPK